MKGSKGFISLEPAGCKLFRTWHGNKIRLPPVIHLRFRIHVLPLHWLYTSLRPQTWRDSSILQPSKLESSGWRIWISTTGNYLHSNWSLACGMFPSHSTHLTLTRNCDLLRSPVGTRRDCSPYHDVHSFIQPLAFNYQRPSESSPRVGNIYTFRIITFSTGEFWTREYTRYVQQRQWNHGGSATDLVEDILHVDILCSLLQHTGLRKTPTPQSYIQYGASFFLVWLIRNWLVHKHGVWKVSPLPSSLDMSLSSSSGSCEISPRELRVVLS